MNPEFFTAHERKCPICGKTFYASGEWVFKTTENGRIKQFCSYKCSQRYKKENMTIDDKINQAIRDGLSDAEIKALLGVTQKKIDRRKISV